MSDLRDSINAALDADTDGNYEETPQEVLDDPIEPPAEPADDSTPSPDAIEPPAEITAESTPPADAVEPAEAASGDSIKAPVDWGPAERDQWSKIPRNLQDKIMERENQTHQLMQTTADARRTHDDFGKLVQQYGSALAGVAGETPMETVGNLFSTVANLRMGSPIQKAQIMADMIQSFGVDINTLDSALTGTAPPPEQQQNAEVERLLNERLAPFEAQMGQQRAYAEQQHVQRQETANTEVKEFSQKAEFLQDVRHDMADFIEMADKRGQNMTMQQAYDKACALNPQIQTVLTQRAELARLNGGATSMAGKRNAASSITGRQIGGGGGGGDQSMRDTIAAAWDGQDKI